MQMQDLRGSVCLCYVLTSVGRRKNQSVPTSAAQVFPLAHHSLFYEA